MRRPKWLVSLLALALVGLSVSGEAEQKTTWVLKFEHRVPRPIVVSYGGVTETYWYFTYKVTNLDREGMAKLAALDQQIAQKKQRLDEEKMDVETFRAEQQAVDAEKAKLKKAYAHRFVPEIWITTETNRSYRDGVFPLAKQAIEEKLGRKYLDGVEVIGDIQLGQSKDAVAIFEQVDPAADHINIFVRGLTNACRVVKLQGKEKVESRVLWIRYRRYGDRFDTVFDRLVPGAEQWVWR